MLPGDPCQGRDRHKFAEFSNPAFFRLRGAAVNLLTVRPPRTHSSPQLEAAPRQLQQTFMPPMTSPNPSSQPNVGPSCDRAFSKRTLLKTAVTSLLSLVCASTLFAQAQPASATVRDHLWLFGCPPDGDLDYLENAGVRGGSRMTPVEGAHWLGVPNLLFVTQDNNRPRPQWTEIKWKAKTTMEQWAISFESMKQVNWAAVGSSGGGGLKTVPDIVQIAKRYPNFTGVYLDDFIKDRSKRSDGAYIGKPAMTEEQLKSMREQLVKVSRPMDVWTTIYAYDLDPKHPEYTHCDPPLVESLKHFDVIVLWTWKSADLKDLEKNLERIEAVKPKHTRVALGIYLWDYTGIDENKKADPTYRFGKPTPLDLMDYQCNLGLKWLKEGRVCDLVILGNSHLDIGCPSAPWMRDWVKAHGEEKLNR